MMKEMGFHKGINFGGWFSQCDYSEERLNGFITEKDFAQVAKWGFDHVRLPIDYNVLENKDGILCDEGFARIEKALLMAKKYGLNMVIDLHKTAGFSFDEGEKEHGFFESRAYQEQFYQLWEALAERFGRYADMACFELLNEVTEAVYIDAWNEISHECIRRLRRYAPDTMVLVGSYENNSARTVAALTKPYDDKVVFNFHCYEPLKFTHQGAYWTDQIVPEERYSFAESNITDELFETLFRPALETAEKYGTELYCGEYGVIDVVKPEDAVRWFQTIQRVFEKHHITRAVWTHKEMDFGISESRMDGVREELLRAL